jgi:hypothetical protein
MDKQIVDFLKSYCYSICSTIYDRVYVLVAVARRKNNENITNSQEVIFREVIKSFEEIEIKYNRIKSNCENYRTDDGQKLNFYIYVSVNARDITKTYWNYLKQLIDIGKDINKEHSIKKIKRLDKIWLSELMKPENKHGRGFFMLDIDTKSMTKRLEIENILKKVIGKEDVDLLFYRETKNGFHYIFEPFNKQKFNELIKQEELSDICEVKIDSLLFLSVIEK